MRRSAEGIVERLERVVEGCLRNEIGSARELTVGLSGGIDSIVLLEIVRLLAPRLALRVEALHVNHGLSPNADAWERFCRAHCARRRVGIECVRVKVAGGGANIEAEARTARYAVFARVRAGIVALAHNEDDQAETVLLQMLRGAGVRGLSAMPVKRAIANRDVAGHAGLNSPASILIRPLLHVSRAEIVRYARRKRLRWIEDESNAADRFARNFLRSQILPRLERRFPGCRSAMARSSAHLARAGALLDTLAAVDGAEAIAGDRIRIASLRSLEPARAANLLRWFLFNRGLQAPSAVRLDEMLRQLCTDRLDARPQLELGDVTLRRFRGWIELSRNAPVDNPAPVIRWTGQSRIVLADNSELHVRSARGRGISRVKLGAGEVTIRRRQGGERMRLEATRPRRTLKNLLQETGMQPWLRARMPLVFHDEELVWAPGIGVAWNFRAQGAERALLFSWNALAPAPEHLVK